MRCRLPFILASTLLGGAAAPPVECTQPSLPGQAYPQSTDLSGRAETTPGLAAQGFVLPPNAGGTLPCGGLQPDAPDVGKGLRSDTDDVVHGLPAPDILRPITDPLPRPEFR